MHFVITPIGAVLLVWLYLWWSAKYDVVAKPDAAKPTVVYTRRDTRDRRPYVERLAEWKRHGQPS